MFCSHCDSEALFVGSPGPGGDPIMHVLGEGKTRRKPAESKGEEETGPRLFFLSTHFYFTRKVLLCRNHSQILATFLNKPSFI